MSATTHQPLLEVKDDLPTPLTDLRKQSKVGEAAWAKVQSRLNVEIFTRLRDIPEDYKCPLTKCFIIEPVLTSDGKIYERTALEAYLANTENKTFPGSQMQITPPTPMLAGEFITKRFARFLKDNSWANNQKYIPVSSLEKLRNACHNGDATAIQEVLTEDPRLLFLSVKMKGHAQTNTESKDADHTFLTPLDHAVRNEKSLSTLVSMLDSAPFGEKGLALAALLQRNNGQLPLDTALRDEQSSLRAILVMMAFMGDSLDSIELSKEPITQHMQNTLDNLLGESIRRGKVKWVECLLKWGAKVQTLQSPEGLNALQLAISTDNVAIVKLCQDPTLVNHNRPDNGETVLHQAVRQKNHLIMGALLEKPEFWPLLNVADNQGKTALHHAAENNHHKIVECLLIAAKEATTEAHNTVSLMINAKDHAGMTALHHASKFPDGDITSRLLAAKADPNVQEKVKGNTALHIAAREGSATVVELLLTHKAKEIKNHYPRTPEEEAALKGFKDIYVEIRNTVAAKHAKEQQELLVTKNQKQSTKNIQAALSTANELKTENTALADENERLRAQLAQLLEKGEAKSTGLFTPRTQGRIDLKKQVREFAELAGNSEANLGTVEEKLRSNPDLALTTLDSVTLSETTYENINALQYAILTLNWKVLEIMQRHIKEHEFATQVHNYLNSGQTLGKCGTLYSDRGFQEYLKLSAIDESTNPVIESQKDWSKLKALHDSAEQVLKQQPRLSHKVH